MKVQHQILLYIKGNEEQLNGRINNQILGVEQLNM